MSTRVFRLLVLITILAPTALLQAQNFSGSDDFSTVSGNWSADTVLSGSGTFSVASGLLNYTDPGLATGVTSNVYRDWIANAGSYTQDWQIRVDLGLGLSLVSGQMPKWNLYIANLADVVAGVPNDYVKVSFSQSYMTSDWMVSGTTYTNGVEVGTAGSFSSATMGNMAVQVSYDSTTQTLSVGYDPDCDTGGYNFTSLYQISVSTTTSWGMSSSDLFGARLQAINSAMAGASSAVTAGTFAADNFVTTAIPEPATYAGLMGLAGLLLVAYRRRRHA